MSMKPPFLPSGCVPRGCLPYGGSSAESRGNCTRTYCMLMSTTEAYLPSRLRQPEAAMAQKGQPPRSPSLSSVSAITKCLLMSYPGHYNFYFCSVFSPHRYLTKFSSLARSKILILNCIWVLYFYPSLKLVL